MNKSMQRRKFLKYSLLTPALCHFVGHALGVSFISKANADSSGIKPRNFFPLWVQGGAWSSGFDYMPGVMNSIGEGKLMSGRNATTFNQITAGGEMRTNYIPTSVKAWGNQVNANLPPIWSETVSLGDGSKVALKSLAEGMAVFQGIRCPVDGHGIVDAHWYNPLGNLSLQGALAAMARRAGTMVSNVAPAFSSLGDPKGFVDPGGQSNLEVNSIKDLLNPTVRYSGKGLEGQKADYLNRRDAIEATMNSALGVLGNYYKNRLPGSTALFDARFQAETYLKKNFDSVFQYFDEALDRYKRVARDAGTSFANSKIWIAAEDRNQQIPSSRFAPGYFARPVDSSQAGPTTSTVGDLGNPGVGSDGGIQAFAMAETLFVHGLSSVYSGKISGAFSINNIAHGGDPHYSGLILLLIGSMSYQHQFASMVAEFKRVMQNKNLWNDTVIQFAGEFNRSPRPDGTGADHGWEGAVTSIYSGAIDGFSAIGNLLKGDSTWGKAGLTQFGGEAGGSETRYTLLEDVVASLSHLTRVPRTEWPNPRGVSIFDAKGEKFQASPRVSWSKIVG